MSTLQSQIFIWLGALLLLTGCPQSPAPTADIEVAFTLIDESGQSVTEATYAGSLLLVFFGFTSCPDICPVTLHNIAAALKSMAPAAAEVPVLFISIDPKTDTPERLAAYTDAIHPSIIGLTGTYDELLEVNAVFRSTFGFSAILDGQAGPLSRDAYEALPSTSAYTPFHSSQVYVVGPDGTLLDIIGYGSKPALIAEMLNKYLD